MGDMDVEGAGGTEIIGINDSSGAVDATIGTVVQALRRNSDMTLRKINWFFIKFQLQLYLVNVQGSLRYVGNTTRTQRCTHLVHRHYMVDYAA